MDNFSEPSSDFVAELANFLRNELCRLSSEDIVLAELIRGFSRRLRILKGPARGRRARELSSESALGDGIIQTSQTCDKNVITKSAIKIEGKRNEVLCRACRIALMEADEAATAQEIYRRIVRRGSFTFSNPDCAVLAIARNLQAMSKEGETFPVSGPPPRWRRAIADDNALLNLP
jgi:hypothetical protein